MTRGAKDLSNWYKKYAIHIIFNLYLFNAFKGVLLRNTAVDAVPFTWFYKNAESETDEKMSRYNGII